MKFSTTCSELQRSFAKVSGVVPLRSTMPILENLLLELVSDKLTVTATDMELSMTVSLQVQGSENGKIAVPSKRVVDTIRALPENTSASFSVDVTTNRIKITTPNGEYNLTGEPAAEFPVVPEFKGTEELLLESLVVRRLIHHTAFAVSVDELRPAMLGVLLQSKEKELRAVATDGHRLVKFVLKMPKETGLKRDIIVPAKALNIVNRSIEGGTGVTMGFNDSHIRFAFDTTIIISKLIDETYPNYETVIPVENDKEMTVNRDQMIQSLRRVALYASAATHQVKFSLGEDSLGVSAQDIDFGGEAKETIPCKYARDLFDIGFNSNYISDILSHLDSEEVMFKFSGPTRAGIVSPVRSASDEAESVIMLVMPVRLTS